MLEIGHTYTLEVVKRVEFGVYLDAKNLGEILLPNRYVPEDTEIGESVEVFVHLDSEDRYIATTRKPRVQVGEFAYLKVLQTTPVGAFLDWGLEKNLLVPFGEQHRKMEEEKSYIVYVYVSPSDDRIVASSKIDKFLNDTQPVDLKPHEQVSLIIANSTDLGYKAIINNKHWGVLNKEEVFQRLSFGQYVKGFVQKIRDDGKINLTLNGGKKSLDRNSQLVLDHLNKNNGTSPLHDKSDPKIISSTLGISKGAFKKALSSLYKQRIIVIEADHIHLNSET